MICPKKLTDESDQFPEKCRATKRGTVRSMFRTHGVDRVGDISRYWLVVWNMNFMTFHSVGNGIIIPTDLKSMIFHRCKQQPPTRLYTPIHIPFHRHVCCLTSATFRWISDQIDQCPTGAKVHITLHIIYTYTHV